MPTQQTESPAPFLGASIALALAPSTYLTALSGSSSLEIRRWLLPPPKAGLRSGSLLPTGPQPLSHRRQKPPICLFIFAIPGLFSNASTPPTPKPPTWDPQSSSPGLEKRDRTVSSQLQQEINNCCLHSMQSSASLSISLSSLPPLQ